MSTWHYMKNGAQTGPISTDELKALIASGAVKTDTMVWREGMAAWAAASTQPEFTGIAPATPPTPPPAPAAADGKPAEFTPDTADVDQNKVMGILAYLGLLFLVPLLAARQTKFAMFHCNQGLILFLASIVAWIGLAIVCFILAFIPVVGWILSMLLWLALVCGGLGLMILGIINAAKGVCKPLPLLGTLFTLVK